MQTPILRGRDFTDRDNASVPGVAIVNAAFVRRYMPEGDPIGQHVSIGSRLGPLEVVGVVKDAVYESLRQQPPPTIYAPYLQAGAGPVSLEVYSAVPLSEGTVRAALPMTLRGAIGEMRTLTQQVEKSLARERLTARVTSLFGVVPLTLAAIGPYGVLGYTVTRRTPEIAIRMALGAPRWDVAGCVVRDAMALVVLGVIIGVPAAVAATRFVSAMLFGLTSGDATTIGFVVAVLVVSGLASALWPAYRAGRIAPMIAMRAE
jgi:hypothetical protein